VSDGDVGEALVSDGLGGDELAGGGLGLASLLSHAETAANTNAPVAQKINPRHLFMCGSCFLSPFGSRRRRHYAGRAHIVWASS
jgi:hypothetical protein